MICHAVYIMYGKHVWHARMTYVVQSTIPNKDELIILDETAP